MASSNERRDINRAAILEHYQHPLHFVTAEPQGYASLRNKSVSCVDDFTAHLLVKDGKIADASFSGLGCAISTAAGSIVTDNVIGKTVADARRWLANYAAMVQGWQHDESSLGDARAFVDINKLPNRALCASVVADSLMKLLPKI